MDLVYICKAGDNEELRYSIRSAVANLSFDNLWVVGGKPSWYTGKYIKVDQSRNKYSNARNNLETISKSEEISESFILMNDDFYILNKVDRVPYMYAQTLDEKIKNREDLFSGNSYNRLLRATLKEVSKKVSGPVLDYELHVPMIMEKQKLGYVLKSPGLWRSTYGNIFNVGGIEMTDVKVYEKNSVFHPNSYKLDNLKYDYLSSSDNSFKEIKELVLDSRFGSKSLYEA